MNLADKTSQIKFKEKESSTTTSADLSTENFFKKIITDGVETYIDNVNTNMILMNFQNQMLPITINDGHTENSFVCSPFAHYVSYANIIVDKIKNPFLKKIFPHLLNYYGKLMGNGEVDKVVIVNNWLFTTNPPPNLNESHLKELVELLKSQFPHHAIIFRSITEETSPQFYKSLLKHKFDLLASRLVFITNAKDEKIFQTRIFKSDMKLLKESKYRIHHASELSQDELSRMVELYQALYIKKYSKLNPQFNVRFVQLAISEGILNFNVLKNENQIDGVFGYFLKDGLMISPFFGYDPIHAEKTGLYRILCTHLLLEAKKHQVLFNQSAGGAFFKKIRRAQGYLEYTAVFTHHLSLKRRLPWKFLKGILNTVGIFFMKRY